MANLQRKIKRIEHMYLIVKETFSKMSKMKILRRKEFIQKHTRITRNNGNNNNKNTVIKPQNTFSRNAQTCHSVAIRGKMWYTLYLKITKAAGLFPLLQVHLKCPFKFIFTGHQGNEMCSHFLKEQLGTCNTF